MGLKKNSGHGLFHDIMDSYLGRYSWRTSLTAGIIGAIILIIVMQYFLVTVPQVKLRNDLIETAYVMVEDTVEARLKNDECLNETFTPAFSGEMIDSIAVVSYSDNWSAVYYGADSAARYTQANQFDNGTTYKKQIEIKHANGEIKNYELTFFLNGCNKRLGIMLLFDLLVIFIFLLIARFVFFNGKDIEEITGHIESGLKDFEEKVGSALTKEQKALYRAFSVMKGKIEDITQERIQFKEELNSTEDLLGKIVRHFPGVFLFTDENGVVRFVNQVYADQFEKPIDEIIGKSIVEILPIETQNQFYTVFEQLKKTKEEHSMSFHL
jgi:PAS domain-containing protein